MRSTFLPVLVITFLTVLSQPQALFGQTLVEGEKREDEVQEQVDSEHPAAKSNESVAVAMPLISTENLINGFIDDRKVNLAMHQQGMILREREDSVAATILMEQLRNVGKSIDSPPPEVQPSPADSKFEGSFQSTLVVANLYDCGRCDKVHVATAGGVVLSADGLVLTNYHVINSPNETFNFFVMSSDGQMLPVTEVLAANEEADVALIRVDADNLKPVKIADEMPSPMDSLFVISHPHDRYFSISTGVVSRHSSRFKSNGRMENWMEITARFSQGSSGCGVFNEEGELIGLVSRKEPIQSRSKTGARVPAITIFKCVPLNEIRKVIGHAE